MDQKSECRHEKMIKTFPATQVLGGGGGGGDGGGGRMKRTEVLSGMIVWNVLVLVILVLAVGVQGRESAVTSHSSHLSLRRSPRGETVKKEGVGSPELEKSSENPTPAVSPPQGSDSTAPQDTKATPKSKEEPQGKEAQEGKGEGSDTQPSAENKDANTNSTTKDENGLLPSHIPSMSTEALLRGFYVFVGVGVIILIYIVIKLARLRKRRAPGKYRVLSHTDDQEMFPLAAGEGEDEEIFNAAHHLPRK